MTADDRKLIKAALYVAGGLARGNDKLLEQIELALEHEGLPTESASELRELAFAFHNFANEIRRAEQKKVLIPGTEP